MNETGQFLKPGRVFSIKCISIIVECDNQIQKDIPITNLDEIEEYTEQFSVSGGMERIFGQYFLYREIKKQRELKLKRTDVFYGRVWRISEKTDRLSDGICFLRG